MRESRVAEQRHYAVCTVADAKRIARGWLARIGLARTVVFGLPEVDDRYPHLAGPAARQSGRAGGRRGRD